MSRHLEALFAQDNLLYFNRQKVQGESTVKKTFRREERTWSSSVMPFMLTS
jgi:hypothetical protein